MKPSTNESGQVYKKLWPLGDKLGKLTASLSAASIGLSTDTSQQSYFSKTK